MGRTRGRLLNRVPVPPPEPPVRMLSYEEAAARLGISGFTLRNWVKRRVVPFYRCGARRIVFAEADLARYLAARRVPARDEVEQGAVAS